MVTPELDEDRIRRDDAWLKRCIIRFGMRGGVLAVPATAMTGICALLTCGATPREHAGSTWGMLANVIPTLAAGWVLLLLMRFCARALWGRNLVAFFVILAINITMFAVYVVFNHFSVVSGIGDPDGIASLWPFPALLAFVIAMILIVLSIRSSLEATRVAGQLVWRAHASEINCRPALEASSNRETARMAPALDEDRVRRDDSWLKQDFMRLGTTGGMLAIPAMAMMGFCVLLTLGPNPRGDAGLGWALLAIVVPTLAAASVLLLLMGFSAYALWRRGRFAFFVMLAFNITLFVVYVLVNYFSLVSGIGEPGGIASLWPFPGLVAFIIAMVFIVLSIRSSLEAARIARQLVWNHLTSEINPSHAS